MSSKSSSENQEYIQSAVLPASKNDRHNKKRSSKKSHHPRPPSGSAFPLCIQDLAIGQVRVFGSIVTLPPLPLELNFLATTGSATSPIVQLTLQGSCTNPIVTLTLSVAGVLTSFSFSSTGGVCGLTATSTPSTGLLSGVVISGLPLLGVTGEVASDCPSTSNLSVSPICDNTGIISGTINQVLRFTGIPAPIPAAVLSTFATQILTSLLLNIPAACLGMTITALITAIPAAADFLTALIGLVGLGAGSTLAVVLEALIPFLVPTVVSDLAALAAAASNIPTALPISTDFKTIFSDCALGEVKKCDKLCIKPSPRVEFKGATPLSITLTATELATTLPITLSTTCLTIPATSVSVSVADFLAAAGIVGTGTIPATGCVSLISGGACIPFSPALTIQDVIVVCIDQGRGCCPPKTILAQSFGNNFANNLNSGVSFGSVNITRGCSSC